MKTMKKLLSSLLAVMLMSAMLVVPASAAGTYSITINGAAGHSFTAYQIFSGTLSGNVLSDIQWGDGVNGTTLLADLQDGDKTALAPLFTGCDSAEKVAEVLEATSWVEANTIEFAKVVANHIATGTSATAIGDQCTISNLAAGYYFVKDTSDGMENDAYSRYMIQLTSNTAVTIKKAVPTLTKSVSLTPNGTFTQAVSAGPSNTVYFSLTAKMHNRMSDFATYPLQFVDTLPTGMDPIEVEVVNAYVNSTAIDPSVFNVSTSGQTVTFFVTDAKATISAATGGADVVSTDTLTVVFSAIVDDTGLVLGKGAPDGFGNQNSAVLVFPNDPNGGNSTASTAPSTASVYSYQLNLLKKDSTNDTPLSGAQFQVSFVNDLGETKYVQASGSNGEYAVYGVADIDTAADTIFTSNSSGTILLKGLREREYHLKEITAPDGYNKINTAQTVDISADFSAVNGDLTALNADKTGTFTTIDSTDPDTGMVNVSIINNQGAVLPTTGGIGTTVFYIAGAILMIGAGAVLVTRKRTQK